MFRLFMTDKLARILEYSYVIFVYCAPWNHRTLNDHLSELSDNCISPVRLTWERWNLVQIFILADLSIASRSNIDVKLEYIFFLTFSAYFRSLELSLSPNSFGNRNCERLRKSIHAHRLPILFWLFVSCVLLFTRCLTCAPNRSLETFKLQPISEGIHRVNFSHYFNFVFSEEAHNLVRLINKVAISHVWTRREYELSWEKCSVKCEARTMSHI